MVEQVDRPTELAVYCPELGRTLPALSMAPKQWSQPGVY